MNEYYLLTFESTHAAISTEKILKPAGVTIMPVPRFISASCGISIRVKPEQREQAEALFKELSELSSDDYAYYQVQYDGANKNSPPLCDRLDPIE